MLHNVIIFLNFRFVFETPDSTNQFEYEASQLGLQLNTFMLWQLIKPERSTQ